MALIYWHNPRCSKSRAGLALLQERGLSPKIRLYLQDPPDAAELGAVITALGQPARALLRLREAREAGISPDLPAPELIAAMAANPKLIERPVLISDKGARIGRPTEALLDIL